MPLMLTENVIHGDLTTWAEVDCFRAAYRTVFNKDVILKITNGGDFTGVEEEHARAFQLAVRFPIKMAFTPETPPELVGRFFMMAIGRGR